MKKLISLLILLLFLTGCGQYVVQVNLTPEERTKYEAQIKEYKEKIQKWGKKEKGRDPRVKPEDDIKLLSPDKTIFINPDGTTSTVSNSVVLDEFQGEDPRVPFYYFVNLALAQETLGQLGAAINTYQRALNLYENSTVGWNNLARLYEQVKSYKKAIQYHEKQIDQFRFIQYYIDIANDYIRLGDLERAEKAYNEYRFQTNLSDRGTELGLTELRKQLKK